MERAGNAGLEDNGFAGEEDANPLDLISLFGQESGARSHKKGGGKSEGSPGVSGLFKGTARGRARSCPRYDLSTGDLFNVAFVCLQRMDVCMLHYRTF